MTQPNTDPLEALVVDCSEDPTVANARAKILDDLLNAHSADDIEAIKTSMRDLEQLVDSQEPRETRVKLTGDALKNHRDVQHEAFRHRRGFRAAEIRAALAATDHQVVEHLEAGKPVPKSLQAHRGKLRDLAAAAEKAKTPAELDAIEVAEP